MNWTISKKILAGYGISIVLLLAVCGSVFFDLRTLRKQFDERARSSAKVTALNDVDGLMREAISSERAFIITGDEKHLAPLNDAHVKLGPAIDRLVGLLADDPQEVSAVSSTRQNITAFLDVMDEAVKLRRTQGFEAAAAVVNSGRGAQLLQTVQQSLDAVRNEESSNAKSAEEQVNASIDALRVTIEIAVPITILVMTGIGIFSARSISRPLRAITTAAGRIAQGEVNIEIPPARGRDEVSRLARSFEQMIGVLKTSADASERIAAGDLTVQITPQSDADVVSRSQAQMVTQLSELIGQVQQSGVQVNSSAVEIAAVAKQQQATASEVASTTTEISSTAKEMSATSTELLKTADQVSLVATETASLATQGKTNLARMEAIIQQINDASAAITSRLGVINEKAGSITTVVTTITKVADQTNLLSLNAAIEAEKAGEYGKGFSVVATEIRRLADQTAASSGDIERIVKEMTSAVAAGVMGMDKFAEEVRRGANEIGETRRQLDEVVTQVQSLAPSVEALHEGMRAQTQGAEQISDTLSQLGEAARQTADSIRDSSRAVEQLNEATRGLQGAIARFKIRS
jgi:methyl-accepting chemotaxis protein WspA